MHKLCSTQETSAKQLGFQSPEFPTDTASEHPEAAAICKDQLTGWKDAETSTGPCYTAHCDP